MALGGEGTGRGTFVLNVLWPWTLVQDVPRAYLG